ncbi:MAG: hypothetical protein K1X55_16995 [Chitinophagales bacterium]|nr:hypothetical protein [Chitinophagales bacterium]
MKNILLHIVSVFWTISVIAQQTDSLANVKPIVDSLDEVQIVGKYEAKDVAYSHICIVKVNASISFDKTLTDYLQAKSLYQINDYGGAGGISFLLRRGTNSDQTIFRWNNIPINTVTYGGFDLSLFGFEGNSTTTNIQEATAPGWNLFLGSQLPPSAVTNFEIFTQYTSLNSIKNVVSGKYGNKKIGLQSGFAHQYSKNNFYFKDVYKVEKPRERITHNELQQYGFQQDIRMNGKKSTFHSNVFYQSKEKEIPALMGSSRTGLSQQNDKTLRWSNNIVLDSTKHTYSFTQGITYDYLNFTDKVHPDSSFYIDARFNITQNYLKCLFESDTLMKFLFISAGIDMSNYWVNTNNYEGLKHETNGSLFAVIKGNYKNYEASLNIQQFIYSKNQYQRPLFAVFAGAHFLEGDLKINCLFSEKFKEPNFNDKYWVPGGNPNLDNELGWNFEGNIHYSNRINQTLYSTFLTGYWMRFKNNIIWNPGFAGVYTPENISATSYKGIETGFDFSCNIKRGQVYYRVAYGFNRSIIDGYTNHDDLIGNVLSYRPQHILKVNVYGGWKYLFVGFDSQFYSKRYTDNDNNEVFSLPGYALFDAYLEGLFTKNMHTMSVQFKVNNLANKAYQVIRSYAQPGRIYSLSFIYKFNKY